jgi:Domain of unknown function (DUF5753)
MVIDEAALRRPIGGPATMRAQIRHLLEVAALPGITVQVLPFSAGGHAATGGPITLLRFPQQDLSDVVYLEQLASAVYPGKPAEIQHYWNVLNQVATDAEPPAATTGILRRILEETWRPGSGFPGFRASDRRPCTAPPGWAHPRDASSTSARGLVRGV